MRTPCLNPACPHEARIAAAQTAVDEWALAQWQDPTNLAEWIEHVEAALPWEMWRALHPEVWATA